MKTIRQILATLLFALLCAVHPVSAVSVHEIVASFELPPVSPGRGALVLGPDGEYWGTTTSGGAYKSGTIYKVKADGSDWRTILSFSGNGAINRGRNPYAGLVSDGAGFFWGTTERGGARDSGTVFKVNASTGVLTTLVEFTGNGETNKGAHPYAELVSDGEGSFWGTTGSGGAANFGTVFKVNASSGVLTTVVEFTDNDVINKGRAPDSALVSDGASSFWGTTSAGGATGAGTIFKVNALSGVLTTLVEFTINGATNKGSGPNGVLVSDGAGFFWSTTAVGGATGNGTVFKVNVSNGALTTLLSFPDNGATNKGAIPYAGLVSDGTGSFLGTTRSGGAAGFGTVFKVNASTGVLTTLVEFTGDGANSGVLPEAELVSDGAGSFWGTTFKGGAGSFGTVFKVNASSGALTTVVEFTNNGLAKKGYGPFAGLASDGAGFFWGTTSAGGATGDGTVFKENALSGLLTTLVEFTGNGATNKGSGPTAGLVSDGAGFFWGTTAGGGASGRGTVFKVEANTGVLTTVAEFTGASSPNKGSRPLGRLVSDGAGVFWGTTSRGGVAENGTIFKVDVNTGVLTTVLEFLNNGRDPRAGLVSDGAGFFWGTTSDGGIAGKGTVFKVNASTGVLTTLVDFSPPGANSGGGTITELVSDGAGSFWGTTSHGGENNVGTVFKVAVDTGFLTRLVQFTGNGMINKGETPVSGLVSDGAGFFWGTTQRGGTTGSGTVFKVNLSTGILTTQVEFPVDGTDQRGGSGYGPLLKHSDGHFYGTSGVGGPGGGGTIFRLRLGPTPTTLPATPVSITSATLQGTINPNGLATETAFEWGTDATLATSTLTTVGLITSFPDIGLNTPVSVRAVLSGLTTGTTYYYRVRGVNADNANPQRGEILSFTPLVDTIAPGISGTFSPLSVVVGFPLPDYRSQVTTSDDVGVVSVTQSPAPGSATTVGMLDVTLTARDAADNAGTVTFAVNVLPDDPVNARVVTKGGAVPSAGTDARIAAGAVWASFGVPAINDAGQVAYLAKWRAPGQAGSGIFIDGALVVKAGDPVAGIDGATWKTFKDPVIGGDGRVAFLGTIAGARVVSGNDTVAAVSSLPVNAGTLAVVAREGKAAPTGDGAIWKKLSSLAIAGDADAGLVLEGTLKTGTGSPAVRSSNDGLACVLAGSAPGPLVVAVREGRAVSGLAAGETVKSWRLLSAVAGSPGQGGALAFGDSPVFSAILATGRQALVNADGTLAEALRFSGETVGGTTLPAAVWKSFGAVATATDGYAMLATLQADVGGVSAAKAKGIFVSGEAAGEWEPLVQLTDSAPGLSGVAFNTLSDPVLAGDAANDGGVAFSAKLTGTGVAAANDTSLWWQPKGGELTLLAREGAQAADCATGAGWKAFTSLAYPGGVTGPIFVASLKRGGGGVNATNDMGVWGVDSTGALRLLFREGDTVGGRVVKMFNVLKATVGSTGVTRAFNARGQVVWQATFTDGTTGIVTTLVP